MSQTFLNWSLLALTAVSLFACSTSSSDTTGTGTATGRIVRIDTKNGTIRFKLYEKETPVTTGNFIGLVDRGFYNGLTFHRVEPGFVVQGGDPKGDGTGGSGKNIPLEVVPGLKHDGPGVVAMARSSDPNSASCQFYITMGPAPHLDGGYAVFGRVIEGQEVVNKIVRGDKMDKVTIEGAASPSAASGSDAGQSDVAGTTK